MRPFDELYRGLKLFDRVYNEVLSGNIEIIEKHRKSKRSEIMIEENGRIYHFPIGRINHRYATMRVVEIETNETMKFKFNNRRIGQLTQTIKSQQRRGIGINYG